MTYDQDSCDDCEQQRFSTPISLEDSFWLRSFPDLVIDRCEVQRAHIADQAVFLYLARETALRTRQFSTEVASAQKGRLLAVRFPDSPAIVGMMEAEDLSGVVSLFDFRSDREVEVFFERLGVGVASVPRTDGILPPDEGPSEAEIQAEELLERLEAERPIWEEIEEALDRGASEEELRDLIEQFPAAEPDTRQPPPSS